MMKENAPLKLMEGYLNVLIDACRRRQYSRVESLLPGAFQDAESLETVDRRLVWIIHEMVDHYLSRNELELAEALLMKLRGLRSSVSDCEGLGSCEIEQVLVSQLHTHKPTLEVLSDWFSSHFRTPIGTSA